MQLTMFRRLVCILLLAQACIAGSALLYAERAASGDHRPAVEVFSNLKKPLSEQDKVRLIEAVENYRFGEYSASIKVLASLRQRYPSNYDILSILALAYEESGDLDRAIAAFRGWVRVFPDDRDGMFGLGRALGEHGDHAASAEVFNGWAKRHAGDTEALILATQQFILAKQYATARRLTQRLLDTRKISPDALASAHYFRVYLALLEGNIREAEVEAGSVAAASVASPYTARAAKLIRQAREELNGLHGFISTGVYYTSNAALLAEPVRRNTLLSIGQAIDVADTAMQTDVALTYRRDNKLLSFGIENTNYMTRSDLNLLRQHLGFGWEYDQWTFMPRFEMAYFGARPLFQGGGLDVLWSSGDWNIRYSGLYRTYNSHFGINGALINLERFSGLSSDIQAQYTYRTEIYGHMSYLTAEMNAHDEATRGDAVHMKSDGYQQMGSLLSLRSSFDLAELSLAVSGHYRLYQSPDPSALAAGNFFRRRDRYVQIGSSLDFPSLLELPLVFSGYAYWQKNMSNYRQPLVLSINNIDSYRVWRVGGSLRWVF
jgi:tetratricopeptide (TPR) repeat protein